MNSFKFNKSDYIFLFIYFTGGAIWLIYRWNIENYTSFEIITGLPGFIIKNLILLFVFRWLINKYLVIERNYVVFVLLAFAAWEIVGFLDMWRDYYTAETSWELPSFGKMLVENFYRSASDSVMLLGIILGKKYYENKLDLVALQNTQREMQLKVLRAQYDPHFLYNSLNTIDALIEHSPKDKVKKYVSHLASLYRYFIQNKEEDLMDVESEIEMAKNYFYLIETRFERDYQFEVQIQKKPENQFLPNGALLTVLENVVKHNQPAQATVQTLITIYSDEITVSNNKTGTASIETFGTGLENLKSRYLLLNSRTISIVDEENRFTIKLPLLKTID